MADAPRRPSGGSLLTKKWKGIPVPVLAVGGGVALILGYRWYRARKAGSAATTTPTGTSGAGLGLGYPMGPSGVVGGGSASLPIVGGGQTEQPPLTTGGSSATVTSGSPSTPPQAATISSLGLPLVSSTTITNPMLPATATYNPSPLDIASAQPGGIQRNLLQLPGGGQAVVYGGAPVAGVPGSPQASPTLGKIIPAKQAIPGEQYQTVPGQPGYLQVIT